MLILVLVCFNPCYNGNKVEYEKVFYYCSNCMRFNPCYNGNKVELKMMAQPGLE